MKKLIVTVSAGIITLTTGAMAIESCDAWFSKLELNIAGTMGKSGTGVVLNQNGEFDKLFASGVSYYHFNDPEEITDGLSEASLVAKANLSKFMKEQISSDEMIEKISSKKVELSSDGNKQTTSAVKKTVKNQTKTIKSHSDALLTGVIKVCESNDASKKEIQVVLAVSPKTAAAASKMANTINKEMGSRKSVAEYEAERKNPAVNEHVQADEASKKSANTVPKDTDHSFSNKAKNMNF